MADETAPRYEFRLFGPDLDTVVSRLECSMDEGSPSESTSLYLLWQGADGVNVKIRDRALDIKDRIAIEQGFEQWRPRGALGFPLDPRDIEHFPTISQGRVLDAETFMSAFRAAGHVLAHVRKRRRHFEYRAILGESGRLLVNGARLDTIAIESTELGELTAFRSSLALDSAQNLGYPTLLKRVTGLSPLPTDSPYRASGLG